MQVEQGEPVSHFLEPRRGEEASAQAGVVASERSPPAGYLAVSGGGQPGRCFFRDLGTIVDGEKESMEDREHRRHSPARRERGGPVRARKASSLVAQGEGLEFWGEEEDKW